MNTRFELSMPGFMNIDFVNQIRKEAKIGGGGSAVIYRGVILDPKLKEVTFPFLFFFFFFLKENNSSDIFFLSYAQKKFDFKDIAIKQVFEDQRFSAEENKLKLEQEIAIIWGISSHPNILTLVGYCDNPPCLITKVFLFSF